jgi:hypothetical protein
MLASTRFRKRALWTALGALWLGAVAAGFAWLGSYNNRPGIPANAPARWPADTQIARDTRHPTLVMLVHPRCTCSRASLGELAELVARARHRPTTVVLMVRPAGVSGDWEQTDLWQSAAHIPGVTVVRDDGGVEAERFGTRASGQTLLYDTDGRLLFSGGITGARGHPGDNAGRAAILALLDREEVHQAGTPVFGCPLLSPDDERSATEPPHGTHAS